VIRACDFPALLERSEQLLDDPRALLTTQEREALEEAVRRAWRPLYGSRWTRTPIGANGKRS